MIICGEEELYVLRLADMIAERGELDLQIQVCTSFEQAEALEEIHCAEIMIIGEEIPYEKRKQSCKEICSCGTRRKRSRGRGDFYL